jgi:hypothetical protein
VPPPFHGPGRRRVLAVALVIALTFVALLVGTGLASPSPHGAGDNGDGVRLYCASGLVPDTPTAKANWQGVVIDEFRTGAPACADPVPSSARIPLDITTRFAGSVWSLSTLGWFYVAVICVGVGLAAATAAVRAPRHALVVLPVAAPLALPVFGRFLLSTYSEPAGLAGAAISLAGIAAVTTTGPRGAPRATALAVALLGGAMAATAKPAYVAVLLPALIVCVLVPPRGSRIVGALVALVTVSVVVVPVFSALAAQDRDYGAINTHNLVFTAVGPASGGDALPRIGLPPGASRALGIAYYPSGGTEVPDWDEVVGAHWSDLRSAARTYVVSHPRTALRMLDVALRSASDPRLPYLPSELAGLPTTRPIQVPDVPVGEQGADASTLDPWVASRPLGSASYVVLVLTAAVAVGLAVRQRGPLASALAVLVVSSGSTFLTTAVTAVAGDGYFEIAKHTWLSAYFAGVSLLAVAALAAVVALGRFRSRPAGA